MKESSKGKPSARPMGTVRCGYPDTAGRVVQLLPSKLSPFSKSIFQGRPNVGAINISQLACSSKASIPSGPAKFLSWRAKVSKFGSSESDVASDSSKISCKVRHRLFRIGLIERDDFGQCSRHHFFGRAGKVPIDLLFELTKQQAPLNPWMTKTGMSGISTNMAPCSSRTLSASL